jgi:hypothetical protein
MVRYFLLSLFLALAPIAARAADEPALPEQCSGAGKGKNNAQSCEQQQDCINAKFKNVLERDPDVVCKKNKDAGWDKDMAQRLNVKSDPNCVDASSVCVGTYQRLKKAVAEYKDTMNEACQFAKNPPPCAAGDGQAAALTCVKNVGDQAKALNAKAKQALQSAFDESKSYRDLSQAVSAHYTDDLKKISLAEKTSGSADETNASTITGNKFGDTSEGGVFSQLKADVNARSGGKSNIAEYRDAGSDLIREQRLATQTIDEFRKQASAELKVRSDLGTSLNNTTATDEKNSKLQTTAGSDVTGTKKDSDSGSLLDKVTSMTKLASAGTGLASAMNATSNRSSTSSPSAAALDGLNNNTGSSTSPTPGSTNSLPSSLGGGQPTLGGGPGTSADNSGKALSRDARIDRGSNLDGYSGTSGARGLALDSQASTAAVAGSASAGAGTYMSAHGSASGASGDLNINESGRDPASLKKCAGSGSDCGAMGDLKTDQFNAGGALGMPKIGAADPALATKGALDNLFGPLPSLDSLIPKDPVAVGAAPALEGMLMNMESPMAGVPPSEAQASTAAVAPANTRSLFDRVHSVHEVALRRGTVALYHKKL